MQLHSHFSAHQIDCNRSQVDNGKETKKWLAIESQCLFFNKRNEFIVIDFIGIDPVVCWHHPLHFDNFN